MKATTISYRSSPRPGLPVAIPVALSLVLTWGFLLGQTGTISGFVRDSTNSESLSFVNVFVQGTTRGAATNRDGYYVITGLPLDTVTVVASIIGYELVRRAVDLARQPSVRLDFRLAPAILMGEEVTVTAQRQRFRQSVEVSTVTLDTREINIAPAFVEADVFRTLQLLPGVQSVSDYSSALYVRGSTPDQNLILVDGITVYSPFHLGGIFSTFNTDAIKEAVFIAGGFPAKYGGRMGSVLEIINRDGNAEEFSGTVNISLISSKALLEGPLPKLGPVKGSFMLAGRRTYFDTVVDAGYLIFKNAMRFLNPQFFRDYLTDYNFIGFPYYFYDLQAKINLDLGANHRLTASTFQGRDVLAFSEQPIHFVMESDESPGGQGEPLMQAYDREWAIDWSWGNSTRSLAWRWLVSPRLILKAYLAGSHFSYGIATDGYRQTRYFADDSTYGLTRSEERFQVFDLVEDRTVRAELTFMPTEDHTVMAGGEHKRLHFNVGWIFENCWEDLDIAFAQVDTALWIEHRPLEEAVYLEDSWRLSSRLFLRAGLRASRYSLHDTTYLDPRLAARVFLRSDLALTAAWGRYTQFLTTANSNDELLRIIDLWLPAPQDRPAPTASHLIAGLEYLSQTNLLIKAEVYAKQFANLVYMKHGYIFFQGPDAQLDPTQAYSTFFPAWARAYGVDLLVRQTAGRLRGWMGYTFSHTRWKTEELDWYPPSYDRAHILHLVGDWQLNNFWHFSTAFSYASGNPYTPIMGRFNSYTTYEHPPSGGTYRSWYEFYLVGEKNSARYPAYQRWDISLVRRRPWGKHGNREFYIQIMNVLNHMNVFMYTYSEAHDPETRERLGIQRWAIPMFPFFPTIGVRYEF